MKQTYYSHGKLLLTGEYVVLDGALSLALPTKKGQFLIVENFDDLEVNWTSINDEGQIWFEESFPISDIEASSTMNSKSNKTEANDVFNTLKDILGIAKQLNPNFLSEHHGFMVKTVLEFPRNWGLGSSSTLINNIASWAKVDAFELLQKSMNGSGYDIACAQNETPIVYQLAENTRKVKTIAFQPPFSHQLYFVHLNKKQDSRQGIKRYRSKGKASSNVIHEINDITKGILKCKALSEFESLIEKHENIISDLIEKPTIKESYFTDFDGCIKSLGAWGGDFILVSSKEDPSEYFSKKGYETIIPFKEMILQ